MFRKKLVKRVASCLMAFAMTVTGFPVGTFIGKAETEESDIKYTVWGGSTPGAWDLLAEENVMHESQYDGVYTISFKMPAYNEEEGGKNNNRFIILRQTEDMEYAWEQQLCLGTDKFAVDQTNFRVENEEDMDITIYYQPESGAVVILDDKGNAIDYRFSWLYMDGPYVNPSSFLQYPADSWPSEYLHIDNQPDIASKNEKLLKYMHELDTINDNNEFIYGISTDGNVYIKSCKSKETDLIIPDKVNGRKVTQIEENAFSKCKNLRSVYIPKSIISIGYGNFEHCIVINGEKDSYAESYANKNYILFNKRVLYDDATKIKVVLPDDYRKDAFLKVEQLSEETEGRDIVLDDNLADSRFYDISLVDANGEKIESDEEVTIMIPMPDFNGPFYWAGLGKVNNNDVSGYEDVDAKYDDSDYFMVDTNEWGIYAFRVFSYEKPNFTYRYKILENGNIEIVDYNNQYRDDIEFTIPKVINGRKVTSIGEGAFYMAKCYKIIVPDTITNIGNNAFAFCDNLESINIPDGVKNIGDQAFAWSGNITSINIPDSVENIGRLAFYRCFNLKKLRLSSGITRIEDETFGECEKLMNIEIPEGVIDIGSYAFGDCKSLEYIKIPKSTIDIGQNSFYGCYGIKNIYVNKENMQYCSKDGVLYDKNMKTLIKYPSQKEDKEYIIPDNVINIEDSAFCSCESLEYIKIPKSTMDIGQNQFDNCYSLKNINVDKENMQYCSKDGVLFDKNTKTLIKYPSQKEDKEYTIPDGVTNIEKFAISHCNNLINVEIPDSVKNMRYGTFAACENLKSVKLPSSIDCIEASTFECCVNLQNINIPGTVKSIGECAFSDCENLTKLEIPSSVKTIGADAFIACLNLTIYGEKGSAIEAYIKNNYIIPFVISSKLYDDSTNIEIEFQAGDKKDDVSLKTKLLSESDEQYKSIILTDNIVDTSIKTEEVKLNAYDITLVDENNNQVQPTKSVTVRIHCPEGYNGAKCKVYRVEGKGKYTDMNASYQNGYMVFDTDHFSTYIVTETELKQKADILYGDANGDGQINTQDAVLIKKYLAEYDNVDIDLEASDVNGDGEVTSADAVLLLKYLAEYDVILK